MIITACFKRQVKLTSHTSKEAKTCATVEWVRLPLSSSTGDRIQETALHFLVQTLHAYTVETGLTVFLCHAIFRIFNVWQQSVGICLYCLLRDNHVHISLTLLCVIGYWRLETSQGENWHPRNGQMLQTTASPCLHPLESQSLNIYQHHHLFNQSLPSDIWFLYKTLPWSLMHFAECRSLACDRDHFLRKHP